MNFGNWIVVAFVSFAIFIGSLVTVCVRQDVDLVSKEYYKEELAYQNQIDRISNARALADKPTIDKINGNTLEIAFKQKIDRGKLNLFCPSNPKMDKNFDLKLLEYNSQLFDVSSLNRGMYRARLFWVANGEEYFLEKIINL